MKQFSCGDVVLGCRRTFRGISEEVIFAAVAAHAGADHGMAELPDSVIDQVRSRIVAA